MSVFERMKAAIHRGPDLPLSVGDNATYRIPVITREPNQYAWQSHNGVILAVNDFAEMVCIQPQDEPGISWRWIWWGYVEKVSNAQE